MQQTIGLRMMVVFPAAVAFILSLGLSPAIAATLFATPSLSVQEAWDSNVFNTTGNEESDFVLRASPSLTLSLQTYFTTISLGGGVEFEKYYDHDELEDNPSTIYTNLTASDPMRFSPRFSMTPSARFVETRDATRRIDLTQSPIPDLPPSETLVTARTEVREYSAALRMAYLVSPIAELGLGGGMTKREFTEDAPGLVDSRTVTGNASLAYKITPLFSTGIYFNTGYNTFSGEPDSRTYGGGLTGTYLISENYTVSARAGATYLKESAGTGVPENEEWSPSGQLSLNYARNYFRATLLGSYEVAGGGSLGTTTKRGNIVLTLADRFAERWSWNLSGYFQNNEAAGDAATEDFETAGGSAGIRFDAARWASLNLTGSFYRQWSSAPTIGDLERSSVLLGFTLSNTYKLN